MKFLQIAAISVVAIACGPKTQYIANTTVVDNEVNRDIVATVEQYRLAVERRDAGKLLMLASKNYWDDAGTADGADDYGYSGLREILTKRLSRVSEIRYSMRYKRIRRKGKRVWVDVLIDASFTVDDANGVPKRHNRRDRNQYVLEQSGDDWQFLSGM